MGDRGLLFLRGASGPGLPGTPQLSREGGTRGDTTPRLQQIRLRTRIHESRADTGRRDRCAHGHLLRRDPGGFQIPHVLCKSASLCHKPNPAIGHFCPSYGRSNSFR